MKQTAGLLVAVAMLATTPTYAQDWRTRPIRIIVGAGVGGATQRVSGELLRQLAGVDIKHIPYRGTPAVITGLLGREVHLTFELVQPVLGQIRAGELKAIAVTSPQRYPALPDVPTVAESGVPEFQVMSWYGLVYPAGTPRPIIDKVNRGL